MLKDIAELLKPREEQLKFAGREVTVRELDAAADVSAFGDNQDLSWKLLTRCVFDAGGKPLFEDADIAELKRGSRRRLRPLIEAVSRVNGFDLETEEKNSDAAPASD